MFAAWGNGGGGGPHDCVSERNCPLQSSIPISDPALPVLNSQLNPASAQWRQNEKQFLSVLEGRRLGEHQTHISCEVTLQQVQLPDCWSRSSSWSALAGHCSEDLFTLNEYCVESETIKSLCSEQREDTAGRTDWGRRHSGSWEPALGPVQHTRPAASGWARWRWVYPGRLCSGKQ